MEEEPPESNYTQAEVYAPMEAEVAEIVAALPDFPGFFSRSWSSVGCSHNGQDNYDYINVEINYTFDEGTSQEPLVRQEYVDVLRDYWTENGYDIHHDETTPDGVDHSIEARRDDGINFWYWVTGMVALKVQSGCVPRSDHSEIQYIPPSGGIVPGGPLDIMNKLEDEIQGYPEAPQEEATSPFTESESPSPTGMVPWAREPDPIETGANPYEDQL